MTGERRQSRSERQEVQEAARRADDGQHADALAEQLARLPEPERKLLVSRLGQFAGQLMPQPVAGRCLSQQVK